MLLLRSDIGRGWSFTADKQTSSEVKMREPAWETLVLFAVNFTRLNVHMNMGNVMGNVSWMTKDFRSDGRLSIGSTGHKNLYIGIGLGGSSLDAKGGIVGGTIELSRIDTYSKYSLINHYFIIIYYCLFIIYILFLLIIYYSLSRFSY